MSDISSAGIGAGSGAYGKTCRPNVRLSTLACSGAGYARHLYAVLTTTKLLRSRRFG